MTLLSKHLWKQHTGKKKKNESNTWATVQIINNNSINKKMKKIAPPYSAICLLHHEVKWLIWEC